MLTDGFPCVVAFDAHDRFISKITLNRAGASALVENSRKFPAFRRPRQTIARSSCIGKAGFKRVICPERFVPKAFKRNVEADRLARR